MITIKTDPDLSTIDAGIEAIEKRKAPIRAAIDKARGLTVHQPAPTASDAEAAKRRSLREWLLGLGDRAAVDKAVTAADREAAKVAAHRQATERERELARLGIEELTAMLEPLDAEEEELRQRRAAVTVGILDAEAHDAAVAYRDALVAAGRALARFRAIAEAAAEAGGTRRLLPSLARIDAPAPYQGEESLFGFAGNHAVHVIAYGRGLPARGVFETVVTVDDARRELAAELAARGLTNR